MGGSTKSSTFRCYLFETVISFEISQAETKVDEGLLAYAQDRIRVLEDALEKREVEERKVIEEALTKQQKEQEKLAEIRLKHELETLKNELTNHMKTRVSTGVL